MEIYAVFNSSLKRYAATDDGKVKVSVSNGTTIKGFLDGFKVIPGEVGLIVLNSNIASQDIVLKDGDRLELYPVIGGG